MKKLYRILCLVMILLAAVTVFAACNMQNGRVLGANEEIITAYIRNIDTANRKITIDEVDLVLPDNTAMINELNLNTDHDFRYGYYARNHYPSEVRTLTLSEDCVFSISDYDYAADLNDVRGGTTLNNELNSDLAGGAVERNATDTSFNTSIAGLPTDNMLTNDAMLYRNVNGIFDFHTRYQAAGNVPYRITIQDGLVTRVDERVLY